ncbi:GFA family protein [Pseudoprimorskyibacter insulae]|uniref:CENP-V/GFA domain-containing protein n=1 Tax=Pseudoprimorskyibacter insulae TaxID=1695997 RepID=A0A2R8ATY5_9RHOB|nr:GFA family protein [Pseudoprimorskyibacter insulae]SPF79522.1 hypothetical protein PRI8871_01318 [Pseudoprimorskyibacter insulae]
MSDDLHQGGCLCGAVRYETKGQPVKAAACHCRYCQLRSGSAFGVSVYFAAENVTMLRGDLRDYTFQTESGRSFTTRFCTTCGTTVFWQLEVFPGLTGVAGATFDPPSFWYGIEREVFARNRAPFVGLHVKDSSDASSSYVPKVADPGRLSSG